MLPGGVVKYTRWLEETHLRPWLKQVLVRRK